MSASAGLFGVCCLRVGASCPIDDPLHSDNLYRRQPIIRSSRGRIARTSLELTSLLGQGIAYSTCRFSLQAKLPAQVFDTYLCLTHQKQVVIGARLGCEDKFIFNEPTGERAQREDATLRRPGRSPAKAVRDLERHWEQRTMSTIAECECIGERWVRGVTLNGVRVKASSSQ